MDYLLDVQFCSVLACAFDAPRDCVRGFGCWRRLRPSVLHWHDHRKARVSNSFSTNAIIFTSPMNPPSHIRRFASMKVYEAQLNREILCRELRTVFLLFKCPDRRLVPGASMAPPCIAPKRTLVVQFTPQGIF